MIFTKKSHFLWFYIFLWIPCLSKYLGMRMVTLLNWFYMSEFNYPGCYPGILGYLFHHNLDHSCICWMKRKCPFCYGLSVCVFLKFICWNPNPQHDGIRRRGIWKVISALIKEVWERSLVPSAIWGYSKKKTAVYQPRLTRHWICSTLILDFKLKDCEG